MRCAIQFILNVSSGLTRVTIPGSAAYAAMKGAVEVLTPSMRTAVADLKLDSLDVVHAGKDEFPLARKVHAIPLARLLESVRTGTRHPLN
jgi:short-subunit dehydrogenase involved in D-alanine esterification of teichoic acids